MAESDGESLESWLNKATNPCNRQEDWEYIISFCDQINKELEGPQIAVRLLAHKIQSPQEWEALQALTVLEACMKNCGRRFHSEVGKFRFLNELIKVVSPKYLGDRVSEKVKSKVVGLLYSWTVALPEENKIKDAYQMLKRQGIVLLDPVIPVDHTLIPSPPARPKNPIFDDDERSRLLARLLKSKNPDDLHEANKLIKSMVKEDEVRMQRVSKRVHTLEEVNNNVKLLQEMLTHYSKDNSSEEDKELIKELFERCETKRLTLFKMAGETEDNDSSLGDILQASDNLSRAISLYKKIVEGEEIDGELELPEITHNEDLDEPPSNSAPEIISNSNCDIFKVDSQEIDFFTGPALEPVITKAIPLLAQPAKPIIAPTITSQSTPTTYPPLFNAVPVLSTTMPTTASPAGGVVLHELEMLGQQLLGEAKGASAKTTSSSISFNTVTTFSGANPTNPVETTTSPSPYSSVPLTPGNSIFPLHQPESPLKGSHISLANVTVPLETIKTSSLLPVTAYDKNGFRILLHFSKDCPPQRPDVLVVVISMLNTAPLPVHNILFQAAVPKSMKVKLQPPSGTEMTAFNPILPPASITQVMLLANPLKEKVRLRFKLSFTLGEDFSTEVGEVDQFPSPDLWGNL
ncbi:ADP-ribosylation factor-binding protein GGA3 isoform X3 [Pyxicephalus adspersus]|uniref:ADP-ribosylation factor-binding protein GGA3 isoform X3 n=1 Tax=Pyxicephalus adspersus TaxID=30357 RepID=UPI003B58E956